ncbi:karyopherin [Rhizoctonia solani AG-1 IA]|uniref:Karyopherin n=1 Tax=Thanatephorus cucumeris (strain AG1-IA) TaxID=983506 RepID=L8WSA2_THACA|nr:karyopherin [Rhizoctonia solani AG-1 IA]
MDPQHVSTLFATTFNADPNVRIAAELELRKVRRLSCGPSRAHGIAGCGASRHCPYLYVGCAAHPLERSVRQAAVVFLKNAVARGYKSSNVPVQQQLPAPPVPDADKQVIKQHILPLIVASPNRAIRIQLAAILKTLVSHDFPERWPGFMENVVQLLQSDRSESVFGGMTALLEIFKTYRSAANPGAPESNSIQQRLSEHQQASSSLVPWGRLFFAVINVQPPADQIPESLDEREKCPWWKAKKWAYATLNRLFMRYVARAPTRPSRLIHVNRYGSPSDLVKALQKQYSKFAQHFATSFAPEILNTYLHQVELNVSGGTWLSKRVTYLIIQFLQQSAKAKTTWQVLKPHIQGLVSSFVFPLLVFTDDKAEAWAADPVEYVRFDIGQSLPEFEDYGTPFGMSTVFIQSLATTRTKASFGPMLNFIQSILGNRFGAHRMTACLAGVILEHPDAKGVMESYVVSHVLPEFGSDHAYLRAVVRTFHLLRLNSKLTSDQACELVTALMSSSPRGTCTHRTHSTTAGSTSTKTDDWKSHAGCAISFPSVELARLTTCISGLLKIADETDLDVLTTAMQTFVEQFSEDLVPIAVQLTTRLIDSYMRLLTETLSKEETAEDWDENADKKFAAMGNARTIQTVCSGPQSNRPSWRPWFWRLSSIRLLSFKGPSVDYLEEMLPSLDNFICFGKEVFAQRLDYREMVLDIYVTSLTSDHLGEQDAIIGCKLIEGLMLSLPGQLDGIIAQVITHALNKGVSAKTKILKLHLLNVFVSALLCSPALALHALGTSARPVFDRWFVALRNGSLARVHDKKLSLLAFCELLKLEGERVPADLQDGWVGIVGGILQLLEEYPKKLEEDFNDEEYELDDETHLNMADDGALNEDVQDEENAYLERLTEESERLRAKLAKDEDSDEDEESDDDDDDVEEELGFESPLNDVDPYIAFKYALTGTLHSLFCTLHQLTTKLALQTANAPVYQAATTSLTPEQATALMEHMARAEAAEREQAQPAP